MPADHVALISRNAELTDEVRRLCAVAGQRVQTASSGSELVRISRAAALVVVDGDLADALSSRLGDLVAEVVVVTTDSARLDPWRAAVQVGARSVLALPADAGRLLEVLALAGEQPGPAGPAIGVIGGRGGAGASTVAVALGWAAAERGRTVTLADFDNLGGGLDVALGLERAEGIRWPDLNSARGVVPAAELRQRLPRVGGLSVVSMASFGAGGRSDPAAVDPAAAVAVLAAARRGEGVVIADLPRWPSDTADVVMANCGVVLLVVPTDVRAVASAVGISRRLQQQCADVRLVVRTDPRTRLRARDLSAALGCEHIATIRTDPGVTAAADRGELVRWLRRSRLGRSAQAMADLVMRVT